jgi:hypothetical protein
MGQGAPDPVVLAAVIPSCYPPGMLPLQVVLDTNVLLTWLRSTRGTPVEASLPAGGRRVRVHRSVPLLVVRGDAAARGASLTRPNSRVRVTIESTGASGAPSASVLPTAQQLNLDGAADWPARMDDHPYDEAERGN